MSAGCLSHCRPIFQILYSTPREGGPMEASILVLIVGSFACWCACQCFKLQENSKQENLKTDGAYREDMHRRRFKDVELPTDWTKSVLATSCQLLSGGV